MGTINLTTDKALAKQLVTQAYEAGLLSAQAPTPESSYYLEQEDNVYRCAIGTLFSLEEARALENGPNYKMSEGLMQDGELNVPEDEQSWFYTLQNLHDCWVSTRDPVFFLEHLRS